MKKPLLLGVFAVLLIWLGLSLRGSRPGLSMDARARCLASEKTCKDALKIQREHQLRGEQLDLLLPRFWHLEAGRAEIQATLRRLATQAQAEIAVSSGSDSTDTAGRFRTVSFSCTGTAESMEPLLRFIALVEANSPDIELDSLSLRSYDGTQGKIAFSASAKARLLIKDSHE